MNPFALDWHSGYGWAVVSLFAGITSFLACNLALAMARNAGMLVEPGPRQSHAVTTPTGGGLGILFSLGLTSVCLQPLAPLPGFWWLGVLPGVVVLGVTGWLDDRRTVSPLLRLFIQLAVSIGLLVFGPLQFSWGETGWLITGIIAMIWSMNLYNFMDGSDGMAGLQGVFAGLVFALLFQQQSQQAMALAALFVAAACAGFLLLNFPPARVFMGDVASVPLGFIFAALGVYGVKTGSFGVHVPVLVMAVFIVDATMTLLARVFRGEQWYTAHAQHVYQRLIVQGWSHRRVLLVYQAINVAVVLPAVVLTKQHPHMAMLTSGLTFIMLAASWFIANRRLGMLALVQEK